MRSVQRIASIVPAILVLVLLLGCGREEPETTAALDSTDAAGFSGILGAGATFPAPLYQKWIDEYERTHEGTDLRYEAVGSGQGIQRFIEGAVDFGASDAAMSDAQIAQVERGVHLIPATAGMVVLAYNLEGLNGELKLKRDVYADIFAGNIRNWNDPRIQESNPDLTLPNKTITLVVRRDSSGTTFAITNHLSAISEEWRDRGPGVGTLIDWPGESMTAIGNEGVASRIDISEGSIGYAEYGFAERLGLPMASLENRAGQFVKPVPASGQQALASVSADMPSNLRLYVPDPEGENAYPIVTYSWLLLYDRYPNQEKASALKEFVTWGLTEGQRFSPDFGYVPVPQSVVAMAQASVAKIQ
jgi:phosphate transport system substrate-binding protein